MFSTLFAVMTLAAPLAGPEAAVGAAITEFAKAGDARDLPALERVLAPQFRVLFTVTGAPQVHEMTRADYLGMAKAGKIGGDARAVTVRSVRIVGPLAHAQVTLTGAKAEFDAMMTLVQVDGQWRVAQDATSMTPK